MIPPAAPTAARRARRRRTVAVGLAAALVVAAVVSWVDRVVLAPTAPAVSTRLPALAPLAHPVVAAVLAAVLLAAVRPRRVGARAHWLAGATAAVVVAVAAGGGFAMVHAFTGDWSPAPDTAATSPDGRWRAAVYSGADLIDPLWSVRVRRTGSPLSRETAVACLDGDIPADGLAGIRFSARGDLVVETDGHRPVTVPLGGDGPVTAGLPGFLRC